MEKFTDDYLLYLLAQASAAVSASFHDRLEQRGVAVSTWRILASLHPDAALTISELAQSCMTKQPTMTRMVDRLVSEDLVTRTTGDGDRRRVLVKLTPKGRVRAAALVAEAQRNEDTALASYSKAERAALKSTLRDLRARAERRS